MTTPLITIAVPTYNNEKTIRKAIDSCLAQNDLLDCEILVVNNASKDATGEVLDSYDGQIRVVTNDETVSLFENHNVALKHSQGKYVIFCHSDDVLYPEATLILKKRLAELQYPTRYICWGHSHFRDFSKSLKNCGFSTGQVFAGQYAVLPFLTGGLTPSGTCYSKTFLDVGGFLTTRHKLAPSDATSMINAALHGFKFEMLQTILFERKEASTLHIKLRGADAYHGYSNAFEGLIKQIGLERVREVILSSAEMKDPPLNFYLVTARDFPWLTLKRTLKFVAVTPSLITKKKVLSILNTILLRLFSVRSK